MMEGKGRGSRRHWGPVGWWDAAGRWDAPISYLGIGLGLRLHMRPHSIRTHEGCLEGDVVARVGLPGATVDLLFLAVGAGVYYLLPFYVPADVSGSTGLAADLLGGGLVLQVVLDRVPFPVLDEHPLS